MANGILTTWDNLPDPRVHTGELKGNNAEVEISVRHEKWSKIRNKHIGDGREGTLEARSYEPWDEWLIPDELFAGVWHRMEPWIRRALDNIIQDGVREALARPRCLRAVGIDWAGKPKDDDGLPRWVLLLRGGAMAVIKVFDRQPGVLVTCFFPQAACEDTYPALRWSLTLKYLVDNYTCEGIVREVPSPEDRIQGDVYTGINTGIRFVTPNSWKFDDRNRWNPPYDEDWDGNPIPEQILKLPRKV